ncbi:MAG TPA: cyclase family protein [Chthoniobacterales bacterium]|nr:cyclase family protein [Chthoniobacterales bacterium]
MTYDITPPITPKLAVWPGDTPLSREVLNDMARGDNITLSTLRATTHLGAHADGPNHYGKDASAIDKRSLDYYLGRCQVIRVGVARATRITPKMLPPKVSREVPAVGGSHLASRAAASAQGSGAPGERAIHLKPRVLFATGTFPNPQKWNSDFAALSVELVDFLHERGVITVGIDTPSVDLFESKDLSAHKAMLRHDMSILEGLVLKDVPEGIYELIALPLRLVGFDASPVRAVLRTV